MKDYPDGTGVIVTMTGTGVIVTVTAGLGSIGGATIVLEHIETLI